MPPRPTTQPDRGETKLTSSKSSWAPLACVDGRYAVIGSWLIAGKPHGMGIGEDATPITRDTSRFVPHFFRSAA